MVGRLPAFALFVAVAVSSLVCAQSLPLIPQPREVHVAGTVPLPRGVRLVCATCTPGSEDANTLADLNETFTARSIPTNGPVVLELTRSTSLPPEMAEEGYTIAPYGNGLTLSAASAAGLFYAAQTAKQLIAGDGPAAVLHQASIRDWPAMRYRGVHDDMSRGPVPTLAFEKYFVRTLAAYKVNVYSPYFEHTQQYAANPLPAPPGGSLSAEDARELTAYASRFHVTVIPEQEAFGHLHHNLTWEQYAPLAELPHGAVRAPAQPGSLALIHSMFAELAGLYPGPFLHIGADETEDLGHGQSKADVDARGLGPVYLDFLERIATDLQPLHRKLLFWADIAKEVNQASPDILRNTPAAFKQQTIAVAWWYTPHPAHGFASYLTPLTAAGFETWVAPGVNNWSLVWPDSNDALTNIQQFVAEGQRQHSTGMLNTMWFDDGEALINNNWYGLLFGAAAGWQQGVSSFAPFQSAFGQVFHGDSTGAIDQAQQELMLCHVLLRDQAKVGDGSDGLFWIDPWSADGQKVAAKLLPYAHDLRLHAERALTLVAQARAAYPAPRQRPSVPDSPSAPVPPVFNAADALPSNPTSLHHPDALDALELGARRMDFIGLKFQLADEIVQGYQRTLADSTSPDKKLRSNVGFELSAIRGVNGRIEDLRDRYALLRDLYQQAWLRSNRFYGLRPVLGHYDSTIALWQARSDRFRTAQRQWSDNRTLPSANDLGFPPTH